MKTRPGNGVRIRGNGRTGKGSAWKQRRGRDSKGNEEGHKVRGRNSPGQSQGRVEQNIKETFAQLLKLLGVTHLPPLLHFPAGHPYVQAFQPGERAGAGQGVSKLLVPQLGKEEIQKQEGVGGTERKTLTHLQPLNKPAQPGKSYYIFICNSANS